MRTQRTLEHVRTMTDSPNKTASRSLQRPGPAVFARRRRQVFAAFGGSDNGLPVARTTSPRLPLFTGPRAPAASPAQGPYEQRSVTGGIR